MTFRLLLALQCSLLAGPLEEAAVLLGDPDARLRRTGAETLLDGGADSLVILRKVVGGADPEASARAMAIEGEIMLGLHFEMSEELTQELRRLGSMTGVQVAKLVRDHGKELSSNLPVAVCLHGFLVGGDHQLNDATKIAAQCFSSVDRAFEQSNFDWARLDVRLVHPQTAARLFGSSFDRGADGVEAAYREWRKSQPEVCKHLQSSGVLLEYEYLVDDGQLVEGRTFLVSLLTHSSLLKNSRVAAYVAQVIMKDPLLLKEMTDTKLSTEEAQAALESLISWSKEEFYPRANQLLESWFDKIQDFKMDEKNIRLLEFNIYRLWEVGEKRKALEILAGNKRVGSSLLGSLLVHGETPDFVTLAKGLEFKEKDIELAARRLMQVEGAGLERVLLGIQLYELGLPAGEETRSPTLPLDALKKLFLEFHQKGQSEEAHRLLRAGYRLLAPKQEKEIGALAVVFGVMGKASEMCDYLETTKDRVVGRAAKISRLRLGMPFQEGDPEVQVGEALYCENLIRKGRWKVLKEYRMPSEPHAKWAHRQVWAGVLDFDDSTARANLYALKNKSRQLMKALGQEEQFILADVERCRSAYFGQTIGAGRERLVMRLCEDSIMHALEAVQPVPCGHLRLYFSDLSHLTDLARSKKIAEAVLARRLSEGHGGKKTEHKLIAVNALARLGETGLALEGAFAFFGDDLVSGMKGVNHWHLLKGLETRGLTSIDFIKLGQLESGSENETKAILGVVFSLLAKEEGDARRDAIRKLWKKHEVGLGRKVPESGEGDLPLRPRIYQPKIGKEWDPWSDGVQTLDVVKQAGVLWDQNKKIEARELLRDLIIRTALDPRGIPVSDSIKLSYGGGTSGFPVDFGEKLIIGCLLLKLPPELAGTLVFHAGKGSRGCAWASRYFSEAGLYQQALPFARLAVFNEEDASYGGGLSAVAQYHFVSAMTSGTFEEVKNHSLRLLQQAPYSPGYLQLVMSRLEGEDIGRFREAIGGVWKMKLLGLPRSRTYRSELQRWN